MPVYSPELSKLTSLSIENAPFVHSEPPWFHEFYLFKEIIHFFLIISHSLAVSRLSHMNNSIFQLNCMYVSTVNQQIRAVWHVSWFQECRRGRKWWGHCPPVLSKGGRCAFFIKISWVISLYTKIELKQIYCSYSRNKKIQNGFL